MTTTFEDLATYLATLQPGDRDYVTSDQIGKVIGVIGPDEKKFYAVQNERGDMFEGRYGVEGGRDFWRRGLH